ncbi:hypothetical protein kam1_487 [Methylacidiphilum kamchatkense Kam1]|uniref:Uncharacterized protein n=1 Tax=Methylacidiphilum kamchatkense Kam1 TaxID=1202785 RepID=A0A516TKI0_9BACT|nr:hypothetical protein kam1_487 [Methylacidiphilum kamchatkense Kam1]
MENRLWDGKTALLFAFLRFFDFNFAYGAKITEKEPVFERVIS